MQYKEPKIDRQGKNRKKKGLLNDFIKYLKKPVYSGKNKNGTVFGNFWDVYRLWSLTIVFIIPFVIILYFLAQASGYDVDSNNALGAFYEERSMWLLLFLALVWAPIMEEASFRLALVYSPVRLSLSLCMLSYLVFERGLHYFDEFFGLPAFFGSAIVSILIIIDFLLLVFIIFYLIIQRTDQNKIKEFYQKYFHYLFYISSIIFSLVHLGNYINLSQIWYWSLILVIPQFLVGLTLAYIRVEYGFKWSVFGHFLHNGILTVPAVLIMNISDQTYQLIESGNEIEENALPDNDMFLLAIAGYIMLFFLLLSIFSLISLWRDGQT